MEQGYAGNGAKSKAYMSRLSQFASTVGLKALCMIGNVKTTMMRRVIDFYL